SPSRSTKVTVRSLPPPKFPAGGPDERGVRQVHNRQQPRSARPRGHEAGAGRVAFPMRGRARQRRSDRQRQERHGRALALRIARNGGGGAREGRAGARVRESHRGAHREQVRRATMTGGSGTPPKPKTKTPVPSSPPGPRSGTLPHAAPSSPRGSSSNIPTP